LIFGLGVSLACLYLATRGTNWSEVGAAVANAHPGWVLAILAASVFSYYVRAQRWRVLLRPVGQVPLYPAMSATAIGFGATMVLPLRLGEVIRPALLARNTGVPVSAALSSVVLERLFDMLLVIACFLLLSVVYPVPATLRHAATLLATLAGVGFLVLLLMQRNRPTAERLIRWVFGLLPARVGGALLPIVDGLLDGLAGVADGATVLLVLGYSAYLWGVITLTYVFSVLALDIHAPLLATGLAAMVIVAAFVFIPQGPGFVGTWQAGCVLALSMFGVSHAEAVGYSLLTWVVQMGINIATAAVFLSRENVSMGQLLRVREPAAPAVRPETPATGTDA
jgi:uncharacterized protein (TIRG00374 family)